MDILKRDLKLALRVLIKSPGFALVAVIVLALGIGANTAIFSVVNAVLLRPLPFPEPDRLMRIWHVPPAKSFPGMTEFAASAANYIDWRDQNDVFDKMSIYTGESLNLTGTSQPETLTAARVSHEFFSVLQSPPRLGRDFSKEEDQVGHRHVVILTDTLWQTRFGADPNIVGRNIFLNNETYTVIGVMPHGFRLPSWAQMFVPLAWSPKEQVVRGEHHYLVIARLKPGMTLSAAQAQMNTISQRLEQQYPEDDKGWGAVVKQLREDMVGDVRPALLVLLGAVAFVLLIACANVANLVLAKTLARRKEMAIRAALGATRLRAIRQVLTETLLISLAGGLLGLVVAHFGVRLIVAFLGDNLPRAMEIRVDSWVLEFTLLLSLVTGLVAGLLPALRLTRGDLNEALKEGLGRTDLDSSGNRTRSALVVVEVAFSLVLLVGAGLMIRTLWKLRQVDPGLDPHNVVTMTVGIPKGKFTTPVQQGMFFDQVFSRVRNLPGVDSAGVIDDLPVSGFNGSSQPVAIEGRPVVPMSEQPEVAVRVITPGYLRSMRIPVVRGRDLNDADDADHPGAVVISESMARMFWPNENAIGKHLTLTFFPNKIREVVGVVGDVKQRGLNNTDPVATLYWPLKQVTDSSTAEFRSFPLTLVARSTSAGMDLAGAIRDAIHQLAPDLPVTAVVTMQDYISESLAPQRFSMLLLGAFAGLAALLAAIGIYSLLSYAVRRRLREIGIRMALGAQRGQVLRMILVQGVRLALVGAGIGLVASLALTRLMASQLFGVTATDPLTYTAVALTLVFVALAACYLPARRATRVDPMVALRYE
jgi:putative ABC transport system permease protein